MAQTSNIDRAPRYLSIAAADVFPVTGSTHLYQGQLIAVQDSTQTVLPATNATTLRFAGVGLSEADNSAGVSSAIKQSVWTSGEFPLTTTGTVAYGDPLYIVDDQTVAVSGSNTSNAVYVGRASQNITTNKWFVAIDGKRIRGFQTT